MITCPCGFEGVEMVRFSKAWREAHAIAHVEAFPDVDQITRDNLRQIAEMD